MLVVDDNVDSAETMAEILKLWGHDVHTDLGLPTRDGFETARRLRQEGLGKLLVAVTGFGGVEDRRRATEAGFDTHLTKPVSPEALRRVLSLGAKP